MNDYQKCLLEIFNEFKRVCSAIGVKYFAFGGTLLGAVRHGGFIPWDDDMDLGMFSDDYYKFIELAPKLISKDFFVQTHETEKEWYSPFMKIRKNNTTAIEPYYSKRHVNQGMWIDIIPFERQTDDPNLLKLDEIKRKRCVRRMSIFYRRKARFKGKLYNAFILLTHPSKETTYKKMMSLLTKYKNTNCPNFGSVFHNKTNRHLIFLYDDFVSFKEIPFENSSIVVPVNYDRILTTQYGDWHRIPDESERENGSGHTISFVDLEKSYKDYYIEERKSNKWKKRN